MRLILSVSLLIIAIFCSNTILAQKKRILVVPLDRFQFVSDYSLEDIAKAGKIQPNEVFDAYKTQLLETFATYNDSNFEFVKLDNNFQLLALKKQISYKLEKFNGKKYTAANLSQLTIDNFKALLQHFQADYLLFINYYYIDKNIFTAYVGDDNKRYPYSKHMIDYDIFDANKQKLLGKGEALLNCGKNPSMEVIQEKSLNPSSLTVCYADLIQELLTAISDKKN